MIRRVTSLDAVGKIVIHNSKTVVEQANSLLIFDSDLQFKIDFDCKVEEYCCFDDLLVVGDNYGTLHFINLVNGDIIHSQLVAQKADRTFGNLRVCRFGNSWELMVVLMNGMIIRLTIPLALDLSDRDLSVKVSISSVIQTEIIDTLISDISQILFPNCDNNEFTFLIMRFDGSMLVYSVSEGKSVIKGEWVVLEIQGTVLKAEEGGDSIIIMDSTQSIYIVDRKTLQLTKSITVESLVDVSLGKRLLCLLSDNQIQCHDIQTLERINYIASKYDVIRLIDHSVMYAAINKAEDGQSITVFEMSLLETDVYLGSQDVQYIHRHALAYEAEDLLQISLALDLAKDLLVGEEELQSDILKAIADLNTYQMLTKKDNWQDFLKRSLSDRIRLALKSDNISDVMLMLQRCQKIDLGTTLDSIPEMIDIDWLILILEEIRGNQREVVNIWILEYAERRDSKQALQLLRWAVKDLTLRKNVTPLMAINHLTLLSENSAYSEQETFKLILKRIDQLEDMIELSEEYNFNVPLEDYEVFSKDSIVMSMLDNVTECDLLPAAIEHMKPFCEKHQIDLDLLVSDYCKETMSSMPYVEWEPRILTLCNLIKTVSIKYDIILETMRRTPLPWSLNLESEMQLIFTSNLPIQDHLEQYKLMMLKSMILRYGVKKFNVSDVGLAQRMVPFILQHTSIVTALEDSVMCLEAYHQFTIEELFVLRAQFLVKDGFHNILTALLSSSMEVHKLNTDQKARITDELVIWIDLKLGQSSQHMDVNIEMYLSMVQSAIIISKDPVYEKIRLIATELKIKISPKQLGDKTYTLDLINNIIQEEEMEFYKKVRFGDLLGFDRLFMIYQSAHYLALKGDSENVLLLAKTLDDSFRGKETCSRILSLMNCLIEQVKSGEEIVRSSKRLLELVQLALKSSTRLNLDSCLQYFKRLEILHSVMMKSDLGAYQNALLNPTKIVLNPHEYEESGLVLSSDTILPMLLKFIKGPLVDSKGRNISDSHDDSGHQIAQECIDSRNFEVGLRTAAVVNSIELLDVCVTQTLSNLLLSPLPDYRLCFAFMLSMPKEKANSMFKNAIGLLAKEYIRLQRVARIGSVVGAVWVQNSFQVNCLDLVEQSKWMHELERLEIPFEDHILRSFNPVDHHLKLIPLLVFKLNGDLETVLQFSNQYRIGDDYVYFECIRQILLVDRPNRPSRLKTIIPRCANQTMVAKVLLECIEKMSYYDYEGLRLVNEELVKLGLEYSRNLLILDILVDYSRTSPVIECTVDPNDESLLDCKSTWNVNLRHSTVRLPYHLLLNDPFGLLEKEIKEETLPRLLPLAQLLDLKTDRFYEIIIQQKVFILQQTKDMAKVLTFDDFKFVIARMKDFELALRSTVFVAGNFNRGEDRIEAYKMALELAERWVVSCPDLDMAQTGCTKIKGMLGVSLTEYTLEKNDFKQFDHLVKKPQMLLIQLLSSMNKKGLEISEEIAARFKIDLDKLKLILLQKWLTNLELEDLEVQNRILFIVKDKVEWGMKHLTSFSTLPASKISSQSRIRALSTLVHLSLSNCSEEDHSKIQSKLKLALYQSHFEKIGLAITDFETLNKLSLARSIWLSSREKAVGVELILKLIIDYNLRDDILLDNVMNSLLINNPKVLIDLGDTLLQEYETLKVVTMYNQALFEGVKDCMDAKLINYGVFKRLMGLVRKRLVIGSDLDIRLNSLFFLSTNLSIGRLLSTYFGLCQISKCAQVQDHIITLPNNTLLALLDLLQDAVSYNEIKLLIRDLIYTHISKQKKFELFLDSKYMESLVQYLVKKDDIATLLRTSLEMGRKGEAKMLLRYYFTVHKDLNGSKHAESDSDLQRFAKRRNLDFTIFDLE